MKKITAIRSGRGRRERVSVSLDGRFAFSLEAEVAIKERLKVGQELSSSQIEALAKSDHFHRCLNAAFHYLNYRPRSEFEVKEQLQRRGFDSDSIEATMARLKERGLVDDVAFAQFWKDNRGWFSPRSQRLIKLELKQKGVASDIIDQVVNTVDDDSAYQAAVGKTRSLPRTDYQSFRRRLGEYLRRRGFSYRVINHVVKQVWQEQEEQV